MRIHEVGAKVGAKVERGRGVDGVDGRDRV
jgi:hypothetical protein